MLSHLNHSLFQRLTTDKSIAFGLMIFGAVVTALILVNTNGKIIPAAAFIALLAIGVITLYRLDIGFTLMMGMVLAFEQFLVPGFKSVTFEVAYHLTLNAISYVPNTGVGFLTPMELHLLFLYFILLLSLAVRKDLKLHPVSLRLSMSLFFLWLLVSVVHGRLTGGDLNAALWEVRALLILGMVYALVPQAIRTREQLITLIWVVIGAISLKAFQGALRYASLGFTFGSWPNIYQTLTSHEDPVFMITLFMLLLGLLLFGGHPGQRRALLILFPILLLGYIAAQRRASYASFMASLVFFIIVLPRPQRVLMIRVLGVFLLFFGLYLGAFWNNPYTRVGAIAQQFKATIVSDPVVASEEDYRSDLYRKQENFNLATTMKRAPLLGVGFGKPYDKPIRLWGSNFALGDYLPHNQIIWILVKMGGIGFFLFWLLFNTYTIRTARLFTVLKDPYYRAICGVCLIAVVNQLVVSYVDMQLAWTRNMAYLGMLMGLVPVIQRLDEETKQS